MTDEQAQQRLNDGICPQCGADIIEDGEPDDVDGHVYWHTWFRCTGTREHTYVSEHDRETRTRYALWEGFDE